MTAKTPQPRASVLISEEEFLTWCEHPVTRFVAAAYASAADEQRESWMKTSWEGNHTEAVTLAILKARADAYRAFIETDWEHHAAMLASEPVWWKFFQDRAKREAAERKARSA